MSVPDIERMYECGDVLANAKGLTHKAHLAEYEEILAGVKGADNCKRLSSQFIARFFGYFPAQMDQSIDAMLDLCEDSNVDIRKQAIKDLPILCKDQHIKNLPKIVDVLVQLLQSEDGTEVTIIQNSIMTLIRRDTRAAIIGIFNQVHTGDEVVRERAIRLIHTKMKTSTAELLNKESQAETIAQIKKVFASGSVTAEEFPKLLSILQMTFLPKSTTGQAELVNMITKMADLDQESETVDFDYSSTEAVDRLIHCANQALPYFSATVKSTKFMEQIVMKMLPHYYLLPELTGQEVSVQDQVCKLAAELAVFMDKLSDPATAASNVFDRLIDYMPLAPASEDGSLTEVPSIEFTKVECLMFAFHSIGRQDETFLKADEERLKDFRSRLQYLARGVQGYIKKLKEFLAKPPAGASPEDKKLKQVALRTNENIQAMIRDLFHSPPIYKATISLSFKPKTDAKNGVAVKTSNAPKAGEKRKPITFSSSGGGGLGGKKRQLYMDSVGQDNRGGNGSRKARAQVSSYKPSKSARPSGHYAPPGGKFSGKIRDRRGSWNDN